MFTIFDVIICIIILLTSVVAFVRGGTRDLLSLLAWVGAAFVTIYFYPFFFSHTETYFVSDITASLFAIIPSFIVTLIVFSIISAAILGNMIGIKLGVLDRSFGALLGFIKGLVIVAIIHFCVTLVAGEEPEWLQNGETYKLSRFGAEIIQDFANQVVLANDGAKIDNSNDTLNNQLQQMFNDTQKFADDTIQNIDDIRMDSFEEEFISEEIIDEQVN